MSLSISRIVVLEIGVTRIVGGDASGKDSHLLFFGSYLLLLRFAVLLSFVEHKTGTDDDFLFRDPKTGIEVPVFCETGNIPPCSSLSCPLISQ